MSTRVLPGSRFYVEVRQPRTGERFLQGAVIDVAGHDFRRGMYPVIVAEQPTLEEAAP